MTTIRSSPLLKSNQYQGLASFSQIGEFIPLVTDATGRVCQDVAPARFALNIPDQDAPLDLYVALIRYHRRSLPSEIEALPKQTVKPSKRSFTDADWQPHPEPAAPVVPRLIPIVCTREIADPITLVSLYRHRWTAQENVIKDFLLPLGLDVNHGYAKQQIENSEFRKQYDALQDKARRLDRWRKSALRRMKQASNRHDRLRQALTDFSTTHYQQLNDQETTLHSQQPDYYTRLAQLNSQKRAIDNEIQQQAQQVAKAYHQSNSEFQKAKRYAKQQCHVQRALLDLDEQLCDMFLLDNRKDQLMSLLNLALTSLILLTRDTFFPESYAHATWKTLQPFFKLPGRIVHSDTDCIVTLRPFNDLALNRDLQQLCQSVNQADLALPNGLRLRFYMEQHN